MVIPERIERKYEPYPEYKDSGVEWLAKVPTHWNIIRLKYGVSLINDKVENGESDTPYLGLENVESWTGRIIETNFKPEIEGASNSFRKDDVLFGKLRPYLAKAVHTQYHGICTSELMVLRPQNYYARFLFYYMLSRSTVNIIDSSTYGVKMPRANWHFIGNLPVVVPAISEQQAIADFLDRETSRIDELIARKQRLIELLQEQRTALISYAVTKGLNPDAPMKDSGVEWLGELPAHWEVKKLKRLGWFKAGAGFPDNEQGLQDKDLPFYKVSDMNLEGNDILMTTYNNSVSRETAKRLGATVFAKDTIIFPKVGIALLTNKRRILTCDACIDNNTMGFFVKRGDVKYLYYRLLTLDFGRLANLGAVPSMNESQTCNIETNVPPLLEQQAIADYLDKETARIDSLVSRINQAIEKLQEYRSALITAAVTGKLDVRAHVQRRN